MGERLDSLDGWVAVRDNLFDPSQPPLKGTPYFVVAYNRVEAQFAISYAEGERHACSGSDRCARAALLSADALRDVNRQLTLLSPALESSFPLPPSRPKSPRNFLGFLSFRNAAGHDVLSLDPVAEDAVCRGLEEYLRLALDATGKRLLFTVLFGEEDYLTDYEEDVQVGHALLIHTWFTWQYHCIAGKRISYLIT